MILCSCRRFNNYCRFSVGKSVFVTSVRARGGYDGGGGDNSKRMRWNWRVAWVTSASRCSINMSLSDHFARQLQLAVFSSFE